MATKPSERGDTKTNRRTYWGEELAKSDKKFDTFCQDGDAVNTRFMLESKNVGDKYNILYSSTETIKPSLYGQTPKVEVRAKNTDTEDSIKVAASMLLEQVGQYCMDDVEFDYVMRNVVSDYVLPGLGTAWARYDPSFAPMGENDNKGAPREYKTGEKVALDYVYWKDIRWGAGRVWEELPWIARRVYFTKPKAIKRFGREKADKLTYTCNQYDRKDKRAHDNPKRQTEIWEIWDIETREVVWYAEEYADDVLDVRTDYLKLKNFYPCPRPLRAVWSTKDFIPKSLYSQYKAQAAELDRLTERIRFLTEALKVRGLYDGSQEGLASLLDGPGNKMVPIQDWAQFIGQGGVGAAVQWVPIQEIVNVLTELFKQREICKNEVYEITGFSDIVRGVSKASETLGAQQIKADWATGRLKDMQREVQRFCRDLIRIMTEIAAEHFSPRTLLLYSGLKIPEVTPEEQQAAAAAMAQGMPPQPTQREIVLKTFNEVVQLIKSDANRCSAVGIETDSTILPDEQKERESRMQFLSSMGAFLQQAGPLAMQYPDMRGLLGGIMMFTLRTFPAARPLEKEFEVFQQKLAAQPPQPAPGQEKGDGGAAAKETATIKAEADKATTDSTNQMKKYEVDARTSNEKLKLQQDHDYRMKQLAIEEQKLDLERKRLGLGTLQEERAHDTEERKRDEENRLANRERQDQIAQSVEDRLDDREDADFEKAERIKDREDAREDAAEAAAQADRQQSLAEDQAAQAAKAEKDKKGGKK